MSASEPGAMAPLRGYMPKILAGIGAAEFDEAGRQELAAVHARVPHDHHAVFQAGHAIGDLGEIAQAQFFARSAIGGVLLFVADPVCAAGALVPLLPGTVPAVVPEVAMVGADDLQRAIAHCLPQRCRGRACCGSAASRHIWLPSKPGSAQMIVDGEEEVLHTGLAHDGIAEGAAAPQGVDRLLARSCARRRAGSRSSRT